MFNGLIEEWLCDLLMTQKSPSNAALLVPTLNSNISAACTLIILVPTSGGGLVSIVCLSGSPLVLDSPSVASFKSGNSMASLLVDLLYEADPFTRHSATTLDKIWFRRMSAV